MAEPEQQRCPYCGKVSTPQMVVGRTQTFIRGVRTNYEVVCCTCGKTYRGKTLGAKARSNKNFGSSRRR